MQLKELIKNLNIKRVIGNTDVEIKNLKSVSSQVTENSLYFCFKGGNFDGHDFVKEVESYGGTAVICEREMNTKLPQIIVEDGRKAMTFLASEFYGHPEKRLKLIGVTGTNGKTTITHIVSTILNNAGIKCGIIGTLGAYIDGHKFESNLTTPDPIDLFCLFKLMVDKGCKVCVMEVSAHSIALGKIEGLKFESGIFTNLTQDHLDFFKSMKEYSNVKESFFTGDFCKNKIINSDDKTGLEIIKKCENSISYGIDNPADVFAIDVCENKVGCSFVINLFDFVGVVSLKLIGKFNVYNALASSVACSLLGVKKEKIIEGLSKVKTVNGRLEKVYDGDYSVFVDFAHTPDGLLNSLNSLKNISKGKIICVFGCGGNRDKGKRSIMGEISGDKADFTVITSDNPRYEDPLEIIGEIEKGVLNSKGKYIVIQDRREAIKYALNLLKPTDVLLVAGKGGEDYQETLGIKKPFSDKDTVKEIIHGV